MPAITKTFSLSIKIEHWFNFLKVNRKLKIKNTRGKKRTLPSCVETVNQLDYFEWLLEIDGISLWDSFRDNGRKEKKNQTLENFIFPKIMIWLLTIIYRPCCEELFNSL